MDKKEKIELIAIYLIIFALVCLAQYLYLGFKYQVNLPKLSFNYVIYSRFFVWQPNDYSGVLTYTDSIIGMIFDLPIVIVNLLFGLRAGIFVGDIAIRFFAATGSFTLIYYLTSSTKLSNKIRVAFGLVPSILLVFNFVFQYITEVAFLPWTLLFIMLALSNIQDGKKIGLYTFFSILFISLDLRFSWPLLFVQNIAVILIFTVISAMFILDKTFFKKVVMFIFAIFVLSLLINLPLIYSSYTLIKSPGYSDIAATNINYVTHNTINQNIILILAGFIPSNGITSTMSYILALVLVLTIFISNLLIKIRPLSKLANRYMKLNFALFIVFIFIIFLSSLYFLPIGAIFSISLPVIYLFALPWLNNGIVFALVTILFPLALIKLLDYTKQAPNYYFSIIVIALLITSLLVYYLFFVPYLKGNPTGAANIIGPRGVNIPQHVFQISNFINSNEGQYAVLTLPQSARGGYNGWQFDTWYNGTNIYTSLISHSVYCGFLCYNPYSQEFFPPSELESYKINKVIENAPVNRSITNPIGVFGIRYIIVEGNALHSPPGDYKEYFAAPKFNLSTIYDNLNKSKNIEFIKRYANSSIYENLNYVPLVYASNVKNLVDSSTSKIFGLIENRSFNIQNSSIFDTVISGFYNDSNTINATPIASFSKPNISFVYNNPTQVTVHVSNATTPYYLVFRETYDPHWAAFYSNGTEVNPSDHIAVNGFANAWYMNKTGNYTITLYYTLQTDAWIAWGVSFAALFVTIGIGVYGWKETRKTRRGNKR
ncbi:MAG: hypothetical protein LVQ97_05195 [Candidatus Micrarchaeales archaeon]|nr:hypothetical protein [Candidatus Micrarchaeales archaeon]